ncbi:serine hydrolase domain-containing protein [Cohnella rhizosphaerae]|uniref:Beta-lactamase family protein n=1 Tax=Cohnella rhizosphaerae TaxID=1457232 RepID=A0A9X4QRV4_9BACL|nr:serine hydrolase domain-containing protein [Cohnella rhizosphaerae]MDG0808663.1 beta-lactamase family protein [Cohnella rhizosphaerae]
MQDIQQAMQNLLEQKVEAGNERGLQLAVYYQGELIVDAYAGIADQASGRAVDGDTLFPVFSTTKGIVATIIHLLAERGRLNYEMKIADIWPEFGVNGKSDTTIGHALYHTSGIPHMPAEIGIADISDWDKMCGEIARLTPQWPPGEHMEYHAITYGWILGEVARRIDGRPFSQILEEEICAPLGVKDMYVGLPEELDHRVAVLEEPGYVQPTGAVDVLQAIPAWICPLHAWMNTPAARRACVPASNGIMSARAAARHYAALLPGGIDGVQLLPDSRMKAATAPLRLKDDVPLPRGMGYVLGQEGDIMGGSLRIFGHGGYGGSIAFADPESGLAVGFTKNLYSPNDAGSTIMEELKKRVAGL